MSENQTREDTIRKLLAKAERTENEHEAAAFFAKAEELMIKWGIENVTTEEAKSEKIEVRQFRVYDPYTKAQVNLAAAVARGFNCRVFYSDSYTNRKGEYKQYVVGATVTVVGFSGDVTQFDLLFNALNVHMPLALKDYMRSPEAKASWSSRHVQTNSFYSGFVNKVSSRLQERVRVVKEEVAPTGSSTALVLLDRKAQVDEYMSENFNLRQGRATRRQTDSRAYGAGSVAGSSANLGGTGIGGSRGSLGR